jgi:hypothetical protein
VQAKLDSEVEESLLETGKTGPLQFNFKVSAAPRSSAPTTIRGEQLLLELQPVVIVSMPCRTPTFPQ